jgi:hypothetical protein
VLDGALEDFNFAVSARGKIRSAQLFRAPPPLDQVTSSSSTSNTSVASGGITPPRP